MIVVDRVEGKFAVCETENGMRNIPIHLIKGNIRDAAILKEEEGLFSVDEEATKLRAAQIRKATQGLWD